MTSLNQPEPTLPPPAEWVLVVDDDESVRLVMVAFLANAGVKVQVAADAPAAMRILKEQATEPVLLFLDVVMPGVDGFTLARKLRTDLRHARIVLMSGSMGEKNWLPADLRELEIMAKPFRHSEVVALVARSRPCGPGPRGQVRATESSGGPAGQGQRSQAGPGRDRTGG